MNARRLSILHSKFEIRNSFLLRSIAVAHAIDCIDAIELRIDGLEFLADPLHVAVDRSLADVVVVRIALARELPPRLDMAGMADQRLQHHEFGDGQLDLLPFPPNDESLRVELQRADR